MTATYIHQVPTNSTFRIDREGDCDTILVKQYGGEDFIEIESAGKRIEIHKDQIESIRTLLRDCKGILDLREQLEEQSKSDSDD